MILIEGIVDSGASPLLRTMRRMVLPMDRAMVIRASPEWEALDARNPKSRIRLWWREYMGNPSRSYGSIIRPPPHHQFMKNNLPSTDLPLESKGGFQSMDTGSRRLEG